MGLHIAPLSTVVNTPTALHSYTYYNLTILTLLQIPALTYISYNLTFLTKWAVFYEGVTLALARAQETNNVIT